MGDVIQMHKTRAARANGAAVAVAITASRLGLSPAQVIACAKNVADRIRAGQVSAARAISEAKADIVAQQPSLQA